MIIKKTFTLEYWLDNKYYIGRLKDIPGVFSQGKTLEELEQNIQEVYQLLLEDQENKLPVKSVKTKELILNL